MFCKNCGAEVADDARFCKSCGATTGAGAAPAKAGFDFAPVINKIKTDKKAMALAILAIIHLVQFIMLFCPAILSGTTGSFNGYTIVQKNIYASIFKNSSTMLCIILGIMTLGGLLLTALRILDAKLGNFNLAAAQKVNSVVICAYLTNRTIGAYPMHFCGWLTLIVSVVGLIMAAHQFNEKK